MAAEIFRFEDFELDRGAYELRRSGRSVRLERIPLDLLFLLVERHGQLVTRQEIVDRVWGKEVFLDAEHGINTAARKIRQALSDNPEAPRFVLTVPAKGYRFVASVEKIEPAPVADSTPEQSPPDRSQPSLRWRIFLPVATFLLAFSVATFIHFRRVHALTEKDTVVLADLANSTGDSVFDDTLKQALSAELSQSPFLNILSDERMSETLQMMGRSASERVNEKTALEICRRTQSAAVLSSSITTLGSQYIIGLKAVACGTGDAIATEQLRAGRKEEVLRVVDREATMLRGTLGESLSMIQKFDVPIEQATTPSLEALQAFSLGRTTLDVKGDHAGAVPLFQRAISLDPNFAMAYASLAAAYSNLGENILAAQNIQKAYELRERVTDRERFYIEAGYYDNVTGELEKTYQVCKLWEQTYPRDFAPHFFLGNDYALLGRYEDGLAEAREALRLDPGGGLTNAFLAFTYATTGQLEQARTTIQEIQAKKLDSPPLHALLYSLAFMQDDSGAMAREVAWAAGKPGVEDVMIANEASTAAFHGQLSRARELSRRAIESAERAGERETAAGYQADAAFREALFGYPGGVSRWAAPALAGSSDRIVQFVAILALAIARNTARAQALAAGLEKRFPQDTIVKFNFLPTLRAQLALNGNHFSQAVEALQPAAPYELASAGAGGFGTSLNPVYVRAEAYLAAGQGREAVAEFQKILGHPSIVGTEAIGPLARLGLARAYAMQSDISKARSEYQDFLALWKDADPDIPILKEAKAKYAKLQ